MGVSRKKFLFDSAYSYSIPFIFVRFHVLIAQKGGHCGRTHRRNGEDFTDAINPERTGANGSKPNVQGRFLDYAEDHAHANILLRHASRVSAALVLNHVLAAFDAAIAPRLHNHRIETNMSVGYTGYGAYRTPEISAAVTWGFWEMSKA